MLKNLLQFELNFHRKQVSFYMGLFVFMFFGFMITGRLGYSGQVFVNSPQLITSVYLFIGLISPMMIGIFAASSVLRDDVNKTTEMVYSSQLSLSQFILSRYFGLVLTTLFILACAGMTMMLRTYIPNGIDGTFTGNTPWHYGWVLLVFILPNVLFCAALSFAVACFTRNVIATYLSGIVIYLLYFLTSMFVGSPIVGESLPADPFMRHVAALVDPFAMSTFEVMTEFWTPAERNSQVVSLTGDLLMNRVIWLSVTAAIIFFVYTRFNLDLNYRSISKNRNKKNEIDTTSTSEKASVSFVSLSYRSIKPTNSFFSQCGAFKSSVALEVNHLLKSYVFWGIVVLWSIFLIGEISPITLNFEFSSPLYAMTSRVLERFQYDLLPRMVLFIVVFYAADMVWREKDLMMNAFTDASPTKSIVFFVSKLVALSLIPIFLISVAILIGVVNQAIVGYTNFELGLYLSLFYYGGLPLILSIAMCLFIQALAPNRYLGMLISVLVLVFLGTNFSSVIGLEHDMWHFAKAPSFRYSDMNGYAHISDAFATYMIYWGSLATLLSIIGYGMWRRGSEVSLVDRIAQIKPQLGQKGIASAVISLIVFITSGSYIFYQSNIATNYYSAEDSRQWRVDYENQFKHFESIPQPYVESIKTEVELFPYQKRFQASGEYHLVNRGVEAVNEVLVSLDNDLELLEMDLLEKNGVKAELVGTYSEMGNYHYRLAKPLLSGEELKLTFKLAQQQSGFGGFSSNSLMTDNASMLHSSPRFPRIGYVPQRELRDNKWRLKYGLAAKPGTETIDASLARSEGNFLGQHDFALFETIVSTNEDQIAVASGSLQKQWKKDGRAYFHYKSDTPIRNGLFYLSSDYTVAEDEIEVDGQKVKTKVYYHSEHEVNVARMLEAMKDALSYQIKNFGAYPHKELKQVEAAEYTGMTGYAAPTMTLLGEHMGFTYDLRNSTVYDQLYRRTAHEVAHQWWGHRISPADIDEGAMVLVETLARYSETMIMKEVYGDKVARNFVNYEMGRYFSGRARESEQEMPLYRSHNGQRYLDYSKGVVALYALQNTIGENKVNQALKMLIEQHAYPNNPATSLDLINLLYRVAPDYKEYIDHWFKRMTYVESAIDKARYHLLANDKYEVELAFSFIKKQVGDMGNDSEINTNQSVEVGITVETENGIKNITREVQVQSGENQLKFEIENKPLEIEIDPRSLLLNKFKFQAASELELMQG